MERWRPSSSVALAMVSLPERRRSSSPLARPRFSSAAGHLLGDLAADFGPVGRPASARAAWAWAAAGSMTSAAAAGRGAAAWRAGRRGRRPRPPRRRPRRRAAPGSRAPSRRARRPPSRRAAATSSASRASAASRSRSRRSASCALAASTAFSRRSNSASDRLGVVPTRAGAGAVGGSAGLRHQDALALVLDRDRLGAAVAEALAHVAGLGAAPAQPERLALAVPSLVSIIPF